MQVLAEELEALKRRRAELRASNRALTRQAKNLQKRRTRLLQAGVSPTASCCFSACISSLCCEAARQLSQEDLVLLLRQAQNPPGRVLACNAALSKLKNFCHSSGADADAPAPAPREGEGNDAANPPPNPPVRPADDAANPPAPAPVNGPADIAEGGLCRCFLFPPFPRLFFEKPKLAQVGTLSMWMMLFSMWVKEHFHEQFSCAVMVQCCLSGDDDADVHHDAEE